MAKDAIGIAEYLMRRRQFDKAIDILEVITREILDILSFLGRRTFTRGTPALLR